MGLKPVVNSYIGIVYLYVCINTYTYIFFELISGDINKFHNLQCLPGTLLTIINIIVFRDQKSNKKINIF